MSKFRIGDIIYAYSFHLMDYEVIGVREYRGNIQYEIKCLKCTHGSQCELLITKNDTGDFVYVSMLNDDDCDQYYWHRDSKFFATKKEAEINKAKKYIAERKSEIIKLEEQIKRKKEGLLEIENILTDLMELQNDKK